MKKIGIMSMQRIHNYGSFLQAYGLKRIIERNGAAVEFVDYKEEKAIVAQKERSIFTKIIENINVINFAKRRATLKKYNDNFEHIIPKYFGDGKNIRPQDLDALVIGSDEVFNCLQKSPVGYSRELFGKGYEKIPVISYAASFGQADYKRLVEYGVSDEIAGLLGNFKAVSVRDEKSKDTVKKLIKRDPVINLDPVLMYDFSKEAIDNVAIRDYIIVYAYTERFTKQERDAIKKFAKNHGKKIVSLGMYQRISDEEIVINPFEIFAYFKHADFIITDTFHGTILSIVTRSNYCTIVRNGEKGNNNKVHDLMVRLDQTNRELNDIDKLEEMYATTPNYSATEHIIEGERKRTAEYINRELEL